MEESTVLPVYRLEVGVKITVLVENEPAFEGTSNPDLG